MANYKFVHFPKEVKFAEVRDELLNRINCQIKNACRGGLFIRYDEGTIESFKINESVIDVENSRSANDENWDTLRQPTFIEQFRTFKRRQVSQDGETFEEQREQREPREPKEPRRERNFTLQNAEGGDERIPQQRDVYRAFVYSEVVKPDDILSYFKTTLATDVESIETFEGKMHYYLTFKTLDDCRAARMAFKDKPLENVAVKPFMTRAMKARRPLQTTD